VSETGLEAKKDANKGKREIAEVTWTCPGGRVFAPREKTGMKSAKNLPQAVARWSQEK